MATHDDISKIIKKFREFTSINLRIPNLQEIADMFGYSSTNSSFKLLQRLEKQGYIEKIDKGKYVPKIYLLCPYSEVFLLDFP